MALTTVQKAGWGLADFSLLTFIMIKQSFVISFLILYLNVPIVLTGWTVTSILIFDLLIAGMVGEWSDNTNGRFGRRAPWMVLGAILMTAGSIGMFMVPEGLTELQNLFWFSGFFAVATIGFTFVNIPYTAMGSEIAQTPEDWKAIRTWRVAFATLGLMLGGIIIPFIAADTRAGFALAILIISPVLLLAPVVSALLSSRAPASFQPIKVEDSQQFQLVFQNSAFMVLVAVFGLVALAVAIVLAGVPFFAAYLFASKTVGAFSGAIETIGIISYMFLALVIGSIISQPIWSMMERLMGSVLTFAVSILFFIAAQVFMYLNLPTASSLMIAAMLFLAGAASTAYRQVPFSIYPDLIRATTMRTGQKIEGVFQMTWISGQRIAYAVAPLVMCSMMGIVGWVQSSDGLVSTVPGGLANLNFVLTMVPCIVLVLAFVLLVFVYYPLSRRELSILKSGVVT
ncbi:MAG: MFS transporter [Pseudomonadota bacterium]